MVRWKRSIFPWVCGWRAVGDAGPYETSAPVGRGLAPAACGPADGPVGGDRAPPLQDYRRSILICRGGPIVKRKKGNRRGRRWVTVF